MGLCVHCIEVIFLLASRQSTQVFIFRVADIFFLFGRRLLRDVHVACETNRRMDRYKEAASTKELNEEKNFHHVIPLCFLLLDGVSFFYYNYFKGCQSSKIKR